MYAENQQLTTPGVKITKQRTPSATLTLYKILHHHYHHLLLLQTLSNVSQPANVSGLAAFPKCHSNVVDCWTSFFLPLQPVTHKPTWHLCITGPVLTVGEAQNFNKIWRDLHPVEWHQIWLWRKCFIVCLCLQWNMYEPEIFFADVCSRWAFWDSRISDHRGFQRKQLLKNWPICLWCLSWF